MSRIASVWPIVEGVELYGYRPMPPRAKFTLATDAEQRAAESLAATREGVKRGAAKRPFLTNWAPMWAHEALTTVSPARAMDLGTAELLAHIRAAWREAHP